MKDQDITSEEEDLANTRKLLAEVIERESNCKSLDFISLSKVFFSAIVHVQVHPGHWDQLMPCDIERVCMYVSSNFQLS